jgi:hypothetical protein
MRDINIIDRRKALTPTPQALVWDGDYLWLSSRDLGTLYKVDRARWSIVEEIDPPGVVWAGVATNDGMGFTIGKGLNDDRYVYRYTREGVFEKLFACPEFTGSYLGFDGEHLYLSQWYKGLILKLDAKGKGSAELSVGEEICGHTIVDGMLYVLRGTEQNGESWKLARLSLANGSSGPEDIARVPFAARSLAFDGNQFWSNHRAGNETIVFTV